MDKSYREIFEAYLKEDLTNDEVMYVKNFPYLYNKLPSPRI